MQLICNGIRVVDFCEGAANMVALLAVCGMAGKIGNGMLADRIGAKWALAGFVATFLVLTLPSPKKTHKAGRRVGANVLSPQPA